MGHWALAFVALPWIGTIFFLINDGVTSILGIQRITFWAGHYWDIRIGMFDHKLGDLIIGLTFLCTAALIWMVFVIGLHVSGRMPLVVYHVALTVGMAGLLLWGTTSLGWTGAWFIVHLFASGFIAFSWNLYRIDALRSSAKSDRADSSDRDNKWAQLIGIVESEPVTDQAVITAESVTVPINHKGGETLTNIQGATEKIAAASRAVSARVIAGPTADQSHLTIIKKDFLTGKWREWPGLSHPGGSFADPIRTAYYDTGADEWFMFAPELKGGLSIGRKSVRRGRTSIGRQGTTGAGKSGDSNNEQAEVFSRRDVLPIIIDVDKFMQNAGWSREFLLMAADDNIKANAVQRKIKELAKVRQARLARYGFREWGPEAYEHPQCRCAAVYLFYDEADSVLGSLATWISAKGLAAGIFGSFTIPSADHESMPPKLRRSVGAWKCFGCGDAYAASFVIDKPTLAAASVNPGDWGAQFPGAHLLDAAPGVDKRLYPITARTYLAEHEDHRAEVAEAREHFEPVFVHPEDEDALGEALEIASPSRLPAPGDESETITAEDITAIRENIAREGEREKISVTTPRPAPASRDDSAGDREKSRPELDPEPDKDDLTGDEEDPYEVADRSVAEAEEGDMQALQDEADRRERKPTKASANLSPEDHKALTQIDPRLPVAGNLCGPNIAFDDEEGVRPADTPESAVAEFDRVLIELAQEGHTEIGNRDIVGRVKLWDPPAISRRMTGLCNGDVVTPPGVSIARVIVDGMPKRGRFHVVWENRPQVTDSIHAQ